MWHEARACLLAGTPQRSVVQGVISYVLLMPTVVLPYRCDVKIAWTVRFWEFHSEARSIPSSAQTQLKQASLCFWWFSRRSSIGASNVQALLRRKHSD